LAFIGIKMIYESRESAQRKTDYSDFKVLLLLSVATSIDAFAVGMTFGFLKVSILIPVIVIGSVTFIVSFIGVLLGDRIGCVFGRKIERVGGLLLIGIGIKILFEHIGLL
jgi:putative Mn2+ efflux pump MntP